MGKVGKKRSAGNGVVRVGSRGSALARAQTCLACDLLASETGLVFAPEWIDTPGDRDLATPIERASADFFTRDLDDAVRSGAIDCAVHSAKDLPSPMPDDLDWFWLGSEDVRDCWVTRGGLAALPRAPRVGVSSARRADYARRIFPRARLLPIRGAIDARIEQLKDGRYDAVLMACAGLSRLYGESVPGVVTETIPVSDLTPPEGQGRLAVTFLKGNARLQAVRRAFVPAVRFVSAGVGSADLITVRGRADIESADVVLYDDLLGDGLKVPADPCGKWLFVGKRAGRHSLPQADITALLCDRARRGERVVRLKGGDAGLFGRLAEETDALRALGIPFLVRPGVSALTAATTPNGLLLTKRAEAAGFRVSTPRSQGPSEPQVFFMATKCARELLRSFPAETPYAMVWDACGPRERVATGLCGRPRLGRSEAPGLLVVGYRGTPFPVAPRVLLTCSDAVMPRARLHFEDRGCRVIEWPMIELRARRAHDVAELSGCDFVVFTSPSSVRIFFSGLEGDRRRLPKIITCGAGTDAELRKFGFASDLMPERDFSARGLVAAIASAGRATFAGKRVLRLRSALAGDAVARALRRVGAKVTDEILYDNVPVAHAEELPPFDEVFFASASGAANFLAAYGVAAMKGRRVSVMGEPTAAALPKGDYAHIRW